MSPTRQDDPGSRDEALARALAQALRPAAAADGCPDAEVLAAYADQGLDAEERARWEGHFAHCARCQKILAVLTVSGDPLAQGEVERLGQLAASFELPAVAAAARPSNIVAPARALPASVADLSAPAGASPASPAEFAVATTRARSGAPQARRGAQWRWLAPAAGVAATVALWFAFRPSSSLRNGPVQTAQNNEPVAAPFAAPPSNGPLAAAAPSSPAPLTAPSSPSPLTAAQAAGGAATRDQLKSEAKAPEVAELDRAAPAAADGESGKEKSSANVVTPSGARQTVMATEAKPTVSTVPAAAPPVPPAAASRAAPPASSSGASPVPTGGLAGNFGGAPSASAETVPKATVANKAGSGTPAGLGGAFGASTQNAARAPFAVAPRFLTFATPDGSVSWRIGPAGSIERSTDQSRTWTPQTSGATTDLMGGDAVSDKIAWVVGRGGVILRTTDGDHWQRVALPRDVATGALPDWTNVFARDALRATIVSPSKGRFVTQDGGQTWASE